MYYRRFKRLRKDQETRDRNAEVHLGVGDFIYPYFVVAGEGVKRETESLPGVCHFSIDRLLVDLEEVVKRGINKILLFGVVGADLKDECGTAAYQDGNLISKAILQIKQQFPDLLVISDVCLCGYTSQGHCGVVDKTGVSRNKSLPLLSRVALSHAAAGVDMVAPSAMLDGQVLTIKSALLKEGYHDVGILSYSAKYASSLYGPFRGVAGTVLEFGDRKTYQMDFRTIQQGLEEVSADVDEGADWVMVKPAHTYLDMIQRIGFDFLIRGDGVPPIVAYHTSGEYMMIKAAASAGYVDETEAMLEVLTAIKRAGAKFIVSYWVRGFLGLNK